MKKKFKYLSCILAITLAVVMIFGVLPANAAAPVGSSDQGDGTYTNPVIWADVPDLDIIRVGDTYWMSSTTMHMNPGVPIMKSYDLVNWETVSYCYYVQEDMDSMKLQTGGNMYSNGTWASSLRYKDGTFYVVVPSPTSGKTYIFQTEDPENQAWRKYTINTRYHDCSLLMDDDGRNWLFYGGGSLIELNSTVTGLKEGATSQQILPSLHAPDPVTGITPTSGLNEGAHIQKIGGKYYIFGITWPSGKPRTQVCHIADNLTGPYESRVIGQESISGAGVAQGGIVDDQNGKWYGFAFRDSGAVGRIPWLVPINWDDKWPMFGGTEEAPSYTPYPRDGDIPVTGFDLKSVVSSDEFYNNDPKPLYYDSQIEPLSPISVSALRAQAPAASADDLVSPAAVGDEIIINGDFEDGNTGWTGRSSTLSIVEDPTDSTNKVAMASGRTETGAGPMQVVTGKMVKGGVYQFSARVLYTNEASPATKQFYLSIQGSGSYSSSYNPIKNMSNAVTATKGQWRTITGTYTVPTAEQGSPAYLDTTTLAIFFETPWTGSPSVNNDLMDFYVDDVTITVVSEPEPPAPDDVIINGGFEKPNGGEWVVHDNTIDSGEPAITITDAEAHSGEYSILTSGRTAVGVGPKQDLTGKLIAGATYELSVWVKYDNENSPGTKDFQYSLNYNGTWAHALTASVPKGEWTQLTGTYTVPGGTDVNAPVYTFIETAPWVSNSDALADPDTHLMDFYVDDMSFVLVELPPVKDPLDEIFDAQYKYNGGNLNMAWQWNHNPDNRFWSLTKRPGWLRLTTGYLSTNILDAPNTLTQRTFGPTSSAVTAVDVSNMKNGDEAGLSLFTAKYGSIGVKMENGNKYIVTTLSNSWSTGHMNNAGAESGRVALKGNTVYLKADANFTRQTDKGNFYYSLDGITWIKLGGELNMTYSTSNHFMGYRFALYNFAKTSVGGYVDFDYYRISDTLTGADAATVLGASMIGASNMPGVAGTEIDIPVMVDQLPDGSYSEIAASFSIPKDLTVTDVVFGSGVTGGGSWEVRGNQLELTVSGDAVDIKSPGESASTEFAVIKTKVNKLQARAVTVSVTPDYILVKGNNHVAYDLNGIKADIGLLATDSSGTWNKQLGDSNSIITHKYGADPFVMEYDGRVYVYMSDDHGSYLGRNVASDEANNYDRLRSLSIISSADMVNWTDHGTVPINRNLPGAVTTWAGNMFAPAAAHKTIDGKEQFFVYFANSANGIGVLQGDSPIGPFHDPIGKELISRSTPGCSSSLVPWLFDPAVLVDDDGKAYLYFGGGTGGLDVNSPKSARCIELGNDMISTVGTAREIDAPGLFEDSGIHKYNGVYYYSYCSNFSTNVVSTGTIHYMVSKSPLGPFTYAGPVLPGPGVFGNGDGGNNHHAIFEFEGNWYIAYHTRQVNIAERASQGLTGNRDYRSPSITPIEFDSAGYIVPLSMDRQGVKQTKTISPYDRVEGETIGWNAGVRTKLISEPGGFVEEVNMALTEIDDGDWVAIGQADFGARGSNEFTVKAAGAAGGKIEVYLDSLNGTRIGEMTIPGGAGTLWDTYSVAMQGITGVHDLFFKYKAAGAGASNLFDIDYWQFSEAEHGLSLNVDDKNIVAAYTSEKEVNGYLILAVYNGSGVMVSYEISEMSLADGGTAVLEKAIDDSYGKDYTFRAFAWDQKFVPLCRDVSLDASDSGA